MELVTGRAGSPHITAQQDRQLHQGIWGEEAYILNTGNMLEPEVQSSNKILIKDGALMFQGALFSVKAGTTDEITINNGNQGMQRKDLVVARYTYDSSQNIESAEWVVIQGTPAASNPVTPSGTSGDIQAGDSTVDCPVFIITLDGINVTGVDVVPEVIPDIPTLNTSLSDNTYFEPGDEVSIANLLVDGVVTGSNKDLVYTAFLPKSLDHVSGASIRNSQGRVRQNGAYLLGGASEVHTFGRDQYTVTLLKDLHAIQCKYTYSGTLSGTNNDAMSIEYSAGVIRFS